MMQVFFSKLATNSIFQKTHSISVDRIQTTDHYFAFSFIL